MAFIVTESVCEHCYADELKKWRRDHGNKFIDLEDSIEVFDNMPKKPCVNASMYDENMICLEHALQVVGELRKEMVKREKSQCTRNN